MIKLLFIYLSLLSTSFADEISYKDYSKQAQYFEVNGHQMAYQDQGKGEEVFVFLHGIPTNSWMYRKLSAEFSKDHRIIAPDMIGFGLSDKPKKALSIDQQSQAIQKLLKNLEIKKFKLVLHDFGGPIGWDLIGSTDFKVTDLVILNTFLYKSGWNNDFSFFRSMGIKAIASLFKTFFFKKSIQGMFYRKQPSQSIKGYVKPYREKNGQCGFTDLYAEIPKIEKKMLSAYQRKTLERVPFKKIKIIWGKHDPFLDSKKQVDKIAEHFFVPKRNIHILENGKHLIADENAKQIISIMREKN